MYGDGDKNKENSQARGPRGAESDESQENPH